MPDQPTLGQRRTVKPASLAGKFSGTERSDSLRGLIATVASEAPAPPREEVEPPTTTTPGEHASSPAVRREPTAEVRRPRSEVGTGKDGRNRRPEGTATPSTRKLDIRTPLTLKQEIERVARETGTTITAVIFRAIEELHGELPALVEADVARSPTNASQGGLFPRRTVERETPEVRTVITVRALDTEIETMDKLARGSGARNRSSMITLVAREWLKRRSTS